MSQHASVLLNEVKNIFCPQKGSKYIDCTLGFAGHSKELLKSKSLVLGIDQDYDAINSVRASINDPNLTIVHGNFKDIFHIAQHYNFLNVDGILFDLGVSSFQFDNGYRGFSFNEDAPLDMRMDQTSRSMTAAELINTLTEAEFFKLLIENSQESQAAKIAHLIIANRPLYTTKELATLIESKIKRSNKIHPATLTFQALRMAVNREIESINAAISQAFDLLAVNGKLIIISFHETEDRLVKRRFQALVEQGKASNWKKKPIVPSEFEVAANPRSRSAKLRAIIKR